MSALVPPAARSSFFRAADGTLLHTLRWDADHPRALVLLAHGLGEHAGRYAALARDLVPRGISLRALDQRGHGRSDGVRGYAPRFSALVDDFEAFLLRATADAAGDLPVFVLGHSFGGLVALRWLQMHGGPLATPSPARSRAGTGRPATAPTSGDRSRPAGAILSAPLLGVAVQAPRWKVAVSGPLSKLLPWLPFSNEIDPSQLSSDPAYVRAYREDPLVHARITPRLYVEMLSAVAAAFSEADRITPPTLFLLPGADTVVDEREVERFAALLPGEVTVRRYPGFHHESLNELGRAKPVGDVVRWIEERIDASAPSAGLRTGG